MISFLESNNYFTKDLQDLKSGHKAIHIQINGIKGSFIIDTGATHNCISKKYYHNFNIKDLEEIKIGGVGSSSIEGFTSSSNELFLSPIKLKNVSFLVINMDHINITLIAYGDKPVKGIIGISDLLRMNAIIDLKGNNLFVK